MSLESKPLSCEKTVSKFETTVINSSLAHEKTVVDLINKQPPKFKKKTGKLD